MFDWMLNNWDQVMVAVLAVMGAASAIAAITPTPKDDSVIRWVRKVIDTLAMNVGNAKNKDPE